VLAARTAVALETSLTGFLAAADQNLGHLETQAAHDVQELLRTTTQRAAQAKADATPPRCPVCGRPLSQCSRGHARTFQTRFGDITIERTHGYCKRCRKWRTPADTALGLEDSAGYSPAVQALAALAASKLPVTEASVVLEHVHGEFVK
jgi:ribosomal protein L34E